MQKRAIFLGHRKIEMVWPLLSSFTEKLLSAEAWKIGDRPIRGRWPCVKGGGERNAAKDDLPERRPPVGKRWC
jgi:hypothetical protein